MKIETLRTLIEDTINNSDIKLSPKITSIILSRVMKVIDLYEKDNIEIPGVYERIKESRQEKVPYSQICPCNPANGGSGVCGCTIGNMMVSNDFPTV